MTRVAVLLSDRLARGGLDPLALAGRLVTAIPDVNVTTVTLREPGAIASALSACGGDRIVLGLGPGEERAADVEAQARLAGLDPLGTEAIDLGSDAALSRDSATRAERAVLLLAGAVARARAFRGSRPDEVRPRVSLTRSRRALFRLATEGYRAIPSIDARRCAAAHGCRRCVDACPERALRYRDGVVALDTARCASCGLCAGACPPAAIAMAGWSDAELDARIDALGDRALGTLSSRGILFVSEPDRAAMRRAAERGWRDASDWLPVSVPCVGMLPVAALLRPLVAGADAVGVVPCGEHPSALTAVSERVAFCRDLLAAIGAPAERVQLCARVAGSDAWTLPPVARAGVAPVPPSVATDPARRAVGIVLSLARAYGASADLTVADERSPLGTVAIDADACTSCGSCADACPTHALTVERREGAVTLAFDAAACCACGACIPGCPESERSAIRLRRAVDRRVLEAGRRVVRRDGAPRCARCGEAIAPAAMVARVAALLGDEHAALVPSLGRYCGACRVLAGDAPGPPRSSEEVACVT